MAKKIQIPLLVLRLSVVFALAVWVGDKFMNPSHTAAVWSNFYMIDNIGPLMSYAAGVVQGLILLAFLLGVAKFVSYGLVFLMHMAGTVTPIAQYMAPYDGANILFFAAWPMLAACFALFMLRDYDTLLSPFSRRLDASVA